MTERQIVWEDPPPDGRGGSPSKDYPVDEWVQRRCEGETLVSIGMDYGITRERVRQLTEEAAPHKPWEAMKRERKRLRAEAKRVWRNTSRGPCPVCGGGVYPPKIKYCSVRCGEINMSLRFHTDQEEWEKHRVHVAKWSAENGRNSEYAKKVLEGRLEEVGQGNKREYGRWFVEGSKNMEYAIEAYENDWPLFERLHPDLQEQIRGVIRDRD